MPTKKKTNKTTRNKEKEMEKQIKKAERTIEIAEKIRKEEEEKKKIEQKRKEELEEKIETIREDLKNQLLSQNKFGKQFDDMIEDYLFFVRLKEELQYDISINGLRYKTMTGNGYEVEKDNASPKNLMNVNSQMLKILQELDLKAPEEGPKVGEGDDLL